MQLWQCEVRNGGEHMMFDVVIHVHVQKAIHKVHVNGSCALAMVIFVLRQTSVLGECTQLIQPASIEARRPKEEQREKGPQSQGPPNNTQHNKQVILMPPDRATPTNP